MMTTTTQQTEQTDSELTPTIDPKTLNLADWRLIANMLEYKPSWAYTAWVKAKGLRFLKEINFDRWIGFASFLGYGHTWATKQYLTIKDTTPDESEV